MQLLLLSVLTLSACFGLPSKESGVAVPPSPSSQGVEQPLPPSSDSPKEADVSIPTMSEAVPAQVEERHETPAFVIDGLQWAQNYRTLFSHIGKARAIEEGRYFLKEGEEALDLHREYEALHRSLAQVALPQELRELRSLMEELETRLGEIIQSLSRPPTLEELQSVRPELDLLRPEIDRLYKLLEAQR
jgi:hypothetical protein